jgi:hypothetical protein
LVPERSELKKSVRSSPVAEGLTSQLAVARLVRIFTPENADVLLDREAVARSLCPDQPGIEMPASPAGLT